MTGGGVDVLVFGLLMLFGSVGCGVLLALENRDVLVDVRVLNMAWTGHLYAALIVGALLACWFMLGAAFVGCRLAVRRRRRAAARTAARGRSAAAPARDHDHPAATHRLGASR
jgi:hypothetical protein